MRPLSTAFRALPLGARWVGYPVVANTVEELLNQVWQVLPCSEVSFRIRGWGKSMHLDGLSHPCAQISRKKFGVGSDVPLNVSIVESSKDFSCGPDLLETGNHLLSFFLVSFVTE